MPWLRCKASRAVRAASLMGVDVATGVAARVGSLRLDGAVKSPVVLSTIPKELVEGPSGDKPGDAAGDTTGDFLLAGPLPFPFLLAGAFPFPFLLAGAFPFPFLLAGDFLLVDLFLVDLFLRLGRLRNA